MSSDDWMKNLQQRLEALSRWLDSNAVAISAQDHLVSGSPERAYWHHGYQCALSDILQLYECDVLGRSSTDTDTSYLPGAPGERSFH